jgi:hypothetical protein
VSKAFAPETLINMRKHALIQGIAACAVALLAVQTARPQAPMAVAPDSPRWDLEGQAKVTDYQGRKCIYLDGGAAVLKDFEMRDGVLDVDVATPAKRGFFGFDFRIDSNGANYEEV